MREDGRFRLRTSYPACRVRQEGHLEDWTTIGKTDGQTEDEPENKSQQCVCTIARPFSLFPEHTFWRFMGHDGFLYLRMLFLCSLLFANAYRKENGQKEKERETLGGMMRNTPCYIPPDSLFLYVLCGFHHCCLYATTAATRCP